jgi:hypothetical protein
MAEQIKTLNLPRICFIRIWNGFLGHPGAWIIENLRRHRLIGMTRWDAVIRIDDKEYVDFSIIYCIYLFTYVSNFLNQTS